MLIIDGLFAYGLSYLKVNLKLFPSSAGGLIKNLALAAILFINLGVLLKFFIDWTFL
jgi:hypothetical protein